MKLQTLIEILSVEAKKPFDYPTQVIAQNLIITARAALIRRQYEQTKTFPSSALIQLCINATTMSSTECCGVDLGCKVTVSTEEVPLPIDVKDEIIFEFVGDILGMTPYGYIKPSEAPYIKYRKFSSKLIYYTWLNRRIIIFNKLGLEKIKLRYVPSNPMDALLARDCAGNPCFDLEDSTFIEDHWEDAITKMVLPKLLGVEVQEIPVDEKR